MREFIALVLLLVLAGCTNNPTAETVLETLEFGPDEEGCFRFVGTVDVSASVWASADVYVILVKHKGDNPPDC